MFLLPGEYAYNIDFDDVLEQSLCMQDGIYQQMTQQGWYTNEQAQQQQIDKVKNKFAQQA